MGKYGVGTTKYKDNLPNVLQLPSSVAEMTVGDMWEDYLIWKEPQVQQVASRINFLDFSAHFFLVLIFFSGSPAVLSRLLFTLC